MPKKSDKPLTTVTLNLITGDRETLTEFYPGQSYQLVVRMLVHRHVTRLRERANQQGVEDRERTQSLAGSVDVAVD